MPIIVVLKNVALKIGQYSNGDGARGGNSLVAEARLLEEASRLGVPRVGKEDVVANSAEGPMQCQDNMSTAHAQNTVLLTRHCDDARRGWWRKLSQAAKSQHRKMMPSW